MTQEEQSGSHWMDTAGEEMRNDKRGEMSREEGAEGK